MTRKLLFGMLVTFVLAFSVQGIADALTFKDKTSSSGDLATELPSPNDFDIKFSVSLGSNTKIYSPTDELISDTGDRIDSSGYTVFDASNGKEYRLSEAANDLDDDLDDDSTLVVGPRPKYNDDSDQAETESGILYVDSSKNVVNAAGEAVYIRSGEGTGDDDGEEDDRYTYVRAKAEPADKLKDEDRYHYDEEQVTIEVTGALITEVGSNDITDTDEHVLMERGKDGTKLSTSMTLTLEAAAPAVVAITISDTTPTDDLPNGAADQAPPIVFTVYVVPGTSPAAELTLTGAGEDGVEIGNDFGPSRIDAFFNVVPNTPLTYQVEGSGRLFGRIT